MKLGKLSLLPYSTIDLSPGFEIPSRVAKFYSCVDKDDALETMFEYLKDYGKYWWDALLDDALSVVSEIPTSSKHEEMLLDVITMRLENLKPSVRNVWELLTLTSLSALPNFTKSSNILTEVSYEVHVRRAYENKLTEYLRVCLNA